MHPLTSPNPHIAREIVETHRLSEAIAQDLWQLYGGRGALNWVAVERHLARLVAQARTDVRDPRGVLISVPSQTATRRIARPEHGTRPARMPAEAPGAGRGRSAGA